MSEYKRFMIFGYDSCYPSGGLGDCFESFETIEEVKTRFYKGAYFNVHIENRCDYYEIFDRVEGAEIYVSDLLK